MEPRRSDSGWTLIEMVVVMALIVVLAGLATAQYQNAVTRSREAVLKEDLFRMRDSIDQYYADKNKYPADLGALVGDGYMREVPKDPFTDSAETWQTTPADPDPANPNAQPGIYNVKSGTERIAIDGTPYADW
jgi:general secretion pathway protein G